LRVELLTERVEDKVCGEVDLFRGERRGERRVTVRPTAVLGEKSEGDEKDEVRGGGFEKGNPAEEGASEPDNEANMAEEARLEVSGIAPVGVDEASSAFLFGATGGGREGGRRVKDCRRRGVVMVEEEADVLRVKERPPGEVGVPPSM